MLIRFFTRQGGEALKSVRTVFGSRLGSNRITVMQYEMNRGGPPAQEKTKTVKGEVTAAKEEELSPSDLAITPYYNPAPWSRLGVLHHQSNKSRGQRNFSTYARFVRTFSEVTNKDSQDEPYKDPLVRWLDMCNAADEHDDDTVLQLPKAEPVSTKLTTDKDEVHQQEQTELTKSRPATTRP